MLHFLLISLAVLILLPLAAQFILGPFIVKFVQRFPAKPSFERIDDGDRQDLPRDLVAFFDESEVALEGLGFEPCGFYVQAEQMPNVTLFLELFHHEPSQDYAVAFVAIGKTREGFQDIQSRVIEFATGFSEGQVIDTNTNKDPDSLPTSPHKHVGKFPQLEGRVAELHAVHRARTARLCKGASRPIPLSPPGGEAEALAETMQRDYQYAVDRGYYCLQNGEVGVSWKGAFLMTWGLCWPIISLRRALVRRRAAKELASLPRV